MKSYQHKPIPEEQIEASLYKTSEERLTAFEKQDILSTLELHMKQNPLRSQSGFFRTPYMSPLSFRAMAPMIAVALIIVLSETVYASQNALPGDVLYPVKTHIAEAVEDLVSVSTEAQATIQAKHAFNRLSEAEKLAALGTLDMKTKNNLAAAFMKKEQNFREKIEELAKNGDVANSIVMNSDFDGKLAAHQDIMYSLANTRPSSRDSLGQIGHSIRDILTAGQDQAPQGIASGIFSKATKGDIENTRKFAKEKLISAEDILTAADKISDTKTEASVVLKAKLDAAKKHQDDGEIQFNQGNYSAALDSFAKANQGGQEIQTIFDVSLDFQQNNLSNSRQQEYNPIPASYANNPVPSLGNGTSQQGTSLVVPPVPVFQKSDVQIDIPKLDLGL